MPWLKSQTHDGQGVQKPFTFSAAEIRLMLHDNTQAVHLHEGVFGANCDQQPYGCNARFYIRQMIPPDFDSRTYRNRHVARVLDVLRISWFTCPSGSVRSG